MIITIKYLYSIFLSIPFITLCQGMQESRIIPSGETSQELKPLDQALLHPEVLLPPGEQHSQNISSVPLDQHVNQNQGYYENHNKYQVLYAPLFDTNTFHQKPSAPTLPSLTPTYTLPQMIKMIKSYGRNSQPLTQETLKAYNDFSTDYNKGGNALYQIDSLKLKVIPEEILCQQNDNTATWLFIGLSKGISKFEQLEALSSKNTLALCFMGVSLMEGIGVNKNEEWGIFNISKAAHQECPWAQNYLGDCYKNGSGVEINPKKAAKWYFKAASQNHLDGIFKIANLYLDGLGVAKTPLKAMEYFEKAAEQGYMKAQSTLGFLYSRGVKRTPFSKYDIEKDFEKSVKWTKLAAKQGWACAQYNLSLDYTKGQGVKQNYKKALYWLKKSAKQGFKHAIFILYPRFIYFK